jgi:hypothetical protein
MASVAVIPPAGAPRAADAPAFKQILLPPGSALPVKTAATELAAKTHAPVIQRPHTGTIHPGDIVLAVGGSVRSYPEAASQVQDSIAGKEWELVRSVGGGLCIAGSTPRNVCRAALGWIEDPAGETDRLSVYRFEERFTMWDNSLNQMHRFSRGFDRSRHIREIARLGHTGLEINRYANAGYHVLHRKFPHDSYAWYLSYAPALDAFVESSLTRGIYRAEELAANRADLHAAADLGRRYGLKLGFVCYEPRCVAEEIFDRYPGLRGSRTDNPGRSLQPRYALDIANRQVLEHYAEMLTHLMGEIPDLRYFVFWTQDSGSGIPFASELYPGPNGSWLARSKTVEEMTADFTRTLLEAGKKINPEFEVVVEVVAFSRAESEKIIPALPKGATVSQSLGGTLFNAGTSQGMESAARAARSVGMEPYAEVTVSAGWDAEPIFGVPAPTLLMPKFDYLRTLNLRRIFMLGGVFSSPQCPFDINQELFAELIRGEVPDLDAFLLKTAERWCEGDISSARLLVEAWKKGDEALASWPPLHGYNGGGGDIQQRWLARPLVPDITRLNPHERAAWERVLFPLESDIGRLNIDFEAGIRVFEDEELDRAVRTYDEDVIPRLESTVEILNQTLQQGSKRVIEDQRDRYRGMLLRSRTERNVLDAQLAADNYLLKRGDPEVERRRLQTAIHAEIANTREWIHVLKESKTNFFHIAAEEETPFLYKTPIEDFALKLEVMPAHINDEPGPYLPELTEPRRKQLLYWQ